MKYIVSILILTFACFTGLYAQELAVQSFVLAETDLTANTPGTMVQDQNGNVCALIKVETTVDGFSFDVGSLGVSDVKRVGAEIWVYVPFGVRRITISHPQLGIIRDYPFPYAIEQARTYILKLEGVQTNVEVENYDVVRKYRVKLEVTPPNAGVNLNGIPLSLDNKGCFDGDLSEGVYELKVSAAGYVSKTMTVKNISEQNIKIILERVLEEDKNNNEAGVSRSSGEKYHVGQKIKVGDEVKSRGYVFFLDSSGEHGLVVSDEAIYRKADKYGVKTSYKGGVRWRSATMEELQLIYEVISPVYPQKFKPLVYGTCETIKKDGSGAYYRVCYDFENGEPTERWFGSNCYFLSIAEF